jgi:hypothetical protein
MLESLYIFGGGFMSKKDKETTGGFSPIGVALGVVFGLVFDDVVIGI